MRQASNVICITEVNQFIIDELRVGNLNTSSNLKNTLRIIGRQPALAVICTLLTESQRETII